MTKKVWVAVMTWCTTYLSLQKELLETCDGLGCLGPRLDVDATEGLGAALAHEAQRGRARMGTL